MHIAVLGHAESLFELSDSAVTVRLAHPVLDISYAEDVSRLIYEVNTRRGKGVKHRPASEIAAAMRDGRCVIALNTAGEVIGHMYLGVYESGGKTFISNTGLVVHEAYRGQGVSKRIKATMFSLAQSRYPDAVMFSLTMNPQIVAANLKLGYEAQADYSNLPEVDSHFWQSCRSCPHYAKLKASEKIHGKRRSCECQALIRMTQRMGDLMMFSPNYSQGNASARKQPSPKRLMRQVTA